ncbi:MAG TPA: phospholipase D-like domain-containing protein [Arsenophonus sp.]
MSKINCGYCFTFFAFTSPTSAITNIQDVEIGFSLVKAAIQITIKEIEEAKNSIDLAAYSFTSKLIALAFVDVQFRGVNVRVVADNKLNGGKYTPVTYLANHCVPVRLNDKYAIMHNKFMVIDGYSIETGSFNYYGIKKITKYMLGFKSFESAEATIVGIALDAKKRTDGKYRRYPSMETVLRTSGLLITS